MKPIFALLLGKHNSTSVPGKNYRPVLGRPLCSYPMMAATHCRRIDRLFVSTDSPIIAEIARAYHAEVIDRPAELALPTTPSNLTFAHGYQEICRRAGHPEYLVLMYANCANVLPTLLERGMTLLDENDVFDSAISISRYDMFAPLRARRLNDDHTTSPVLDLNALGLRNIAERTAMGDIYFADFGVQVVRPERCLEKPTEGALPFPWLGQKQGAVISDYGFDVDYAWQFAVIEHWLREHGFSENKTPYE
jgi:CMP-N-acetylneuraminic acid synthetase